MGSEMRQIAYILFKEVEDHPWWMKFLKQDMRHCFCIKTNNILGQEYSIIFENLFNYISIEVSFLPINQLLSELYSEGMTVVRYEYDAATLKRKHYYEPISCVTTVKQLLGISDWKVQTPYQLYKKLTK